jgi:hypothetical protein
MYAVPAAPACAAAAHSPRGKNMRLLPTGASKKGSSTGVPSTVVRRSQVPIAAALRGKKRTRSKTAQFSRKVTSPSAPPSM